jgi:hypothetical protein
MILDPSFSFPDPGLTRSRIQDSDLHQRIKVF